MIYRRDWSPSLPFGLGIIVWGLTNAMNHLVCSLVFGTYEPGIVTGLLWIPLTAWVYRDLKRAGLLPARVMLLSALVAVVVYWTFPMVIFIEVDKVFGL